MFEVLNRMLDNIQDHKRQSLCKGTALRSELKRVMHIDESSISILLIE